ncbi:hypothetical protein [Rhodanobacter sp. B05]|uniref:hypothetical protein n=1 Tax=Rhodanobacter sp. B05 TaxID=1945859 RepID=UPI0011158726|nr:hypothetical protein [Rhodanobacter sp. B05]
MYIKIISAAATLSAILALSGCVTATPIMTPSGQQGFSLNCSAMNDIGQCYKKAGELCGGNGYEIFDQSNTPQKFFSAANQTMVIRCKAPVSARS